MDILMRWFRSSFFWFLLSLLTISGLVAIGPEEATLGSNVRVVYLHGAWVLTAEAFLALAAVAGFFALLMRREKSHTWSAALGRTGIIFWIIYLPLSLWAMQANWNGLFLSEPRFRIAFIFAVTGTLLQMGLAFLSRPVITSLANVLFFTCLWIILRQADYVLHPPPSPIFSSGSLALQLYFIGLIFLNMVAAYFLTRWWLQKTS